jgi:ABC-2 type transport system permease protein
MILLFVFLTLYGAFILNGVIEEKTSRVVEVLLSTVRPNELLIGKVIGIGLVGTIQGGVLVAATFIARAAVPGAADAALTPAVVGYTVLWFVLGFAMYAWMYAAAGSLVSRSEDAQNLVFPLQIPLVGSYAVGLLASLNGPNPVLNAMSMFPLTAPMTMLERMAAQQVPFWQVAVSIVLCLITAYLTMRLAIAIFAGGILRSGQRVSLLDAWRNPAG